MALAKRTILMVVVGLIVLVGGIGGGLFLGLKYFSSPPETTRETDIPDPGPMIDLGQFMSTMADPEVRIVRVNVTVELSGPAVSNRLADPGWIVMMQDEILSTLKDQRFDNVRYAEGMEKLKLDLRSRLNEILPRVDGELPVRRVLFNEFMTQ
ncbi:MAG: flagellar basal body-associated FliL family protein [Synergistaceae bacterium]|nr:flagellar basal body-associated FliL family protein [Synergistaceae bacterium]